MGTSIEMVKSIWGVYESDKARSVETARLSILSFEFWVKILGALVFVGGLNFVP